MLLFHPTLELCSKYDTVWCDMVWVIHWVGVMLTHINPSSLVGVVLKMLLFHPTTELCSKCDTAWCDWYKYICRCKMWTHVSSINLLGVVLKHAAFELCSKYDMVCYGMVWLVHLVRAVWTHVSPSSILVGIILNCATFLSNCGT